MKDICLNCKIEYDNIAWGAECNCENPNVVHRIYCDGCTNILGYINSDDYIGLKKIYCNECLNKALHQTLNQ